MTPSKISLSEPIIFRAVGHLILTPSVAVPIRVALPRRETCMGILTMKPLSELGEVLFREALRYDHTVSLWIGCCRFECRVAAKADETGRVLIRADDFLRGVSTAAKVYQPDDGGSVDEDTEAWRNAG
jgi:hypothetical protein